MTRWPRTIALVGLLAYLVVSVDHLAVFPAIGEDEPWIAAAPHKLATQGVLGSDLFAGQYGMERHHYQQMPLYPLIQAAIFKLFGTGVLQMRALPVACGLLLILAVFLVGRQLRDERTGALAVVVMLLLRVADGAASTGILLLDGARINRYDILVPVFGLLALWVFNRAEGDHRASDYLLAGFLAGLSGLTHLYGVFWLPVFVALLAARRGLRVWHERGLWLLAGGFACAWIPWALWVVSGWPDFLGQMRMAPGRFNIFDPHFYVENIVGGAGPISVDWLIRTARGMPLDRVGSWTAMVALPVAWIALIVSARRRKDSAASALAIACLLQTVLFVALLKVKTLHYMIALWPLGALLLSWFAIEAWDRRRPLARSLLVVVFALVTVEGSSRVVHAWHNAREVTAYDWYEAEIASCIPAGSRVLGLQHYWLGLRQFPYRTWLLPIDLAQPGYSAEPLALDAALERVNPDVILVDRHIDDLMTNGRNPTDPNHRLAIGFDAFMRQRRAALTCVIKDRTYGPMQIFVVPPAV